MESYGYYGLQFNKLKLISQNIKAYAYQSIPFYRNVWNYRELKSMLILWGIVLNYFIPFWNNTNPESYILSFVIKYVGASLLTT